MGSLATSGEAGIPAVGISRGFIRRGDGRCMSPKGALGTRQSGDCLYRWEKQGMSMCDGGGARGGPGGREGAGFGWALGEQWGAKPGVGWEAACPRWGGGKAGAGAAVRLGGEGPGLLPR